MKNNILFCFFVSILASYNIYAQSENYAKFYNKGNKFIENNFEEAEKNFRVAIDDSLSDLRATFNLSNKYYSEGLYDEAISRQIESTKLAKNKSEKHKAFHNLGNSLMKKEMCSRKHDDEKGTESRRHGIARFRLDYFQPFTCQYSPRSFLFGPIMGKQRASRLKRIPIL